MKFKTSLMAGILAGVAFSANAVDTTITVTGTVEQKTCTTPTNVAVPLGTLYTNDFSASGTASSWQNFNLELTGCQGVTSVEATFHGTPDDSDPKLYKNSGDASNIAVDIQDKNAADIQFSDNTIKTVRADSSGNATLSLRARAVSTADTITPGSIESIITVTYRYI